MLKNHLLTLSDYMILLKPVPPQISSLKLTLDKFSKIDINMHKNVENTGEQGSRVRKSKEKH